MTSAECSGPFAEENINGNLGFVKKNLHKMENIR